MTDKIDNKKGQDRNPAKQDAVKRLLSYAGNRKPLLSLSLLSSGVSALFSFVPYIMVFFVMRDVVSAVVAKEAVDYSALMYYGLWAVGSAAGGFVLYYIALLLSHATAFAIQENLSVSITQTLADLPIGWHLTHESGKVRKVFEKNINQLETLIAHNLPDVAQNIVSPLAILGLMLVFDWRLGLIALLPLVLAFVIQAILMQVSANADFMRNYEDALEQMNSAGTEYVRGISVVKTFNQSVYYFKNFYTSIMKYKEFVHKYSLSWENSYSIFLSLIKLGFLFLLPAALLLAGTATLDLHFFYSFVFYLAFAPVTYSMLIKIMYANTFHQRSNNALNRIEDILHASLTKEPEISILPKKYDIEFKDVRFSYKTQSEHDGENRNAIDGISLKIPEHSLTALVGPSGGGKTTLANLLGRFWEIDSGSISVGGVDIRDIKTTDLMHTIGFVFQENKLFKESIF